MKSRTTINYHQLYTELERLREKRGSPDDPSNFFSFLKSWQFWFEVAKIIFKIFF